MWMPASMGTNQLPECRKLRSHHIFHVLQAKETTYMGRALPLLFSFLFYCNESNANYGEWGNGVMGVLVEVGLNGRRYPVHDFGQSAHDALKLPSMGVRATVSIESVQQIREAFSSLFSYVVSKFL